MMKALKRIAAISFLLTCSIHDVGEPIFIFLFMYLIEFFNSFGYQNAGIEWGLGILSVVVLGTLYLFRISNKFSDRFFTLFYIISLFAYLLTSTGILDQSNYRNISIWFVVPFLVFIVSSIMVIKKSFKKAN